MPWRELEITPAEFVALRKLEAECTESFLFLGIGGGIRPVFDTFRWVKGVREILGDRAPPADGEPTRLKVV